MVPADGVTDARDQRRSRGWRWFLPARESRICLLFNRWAVTVFAGSRPLEGSLRLPILVSSEEHRSDLVLCPIEDGCLWNGIEGLVVDSDVWFDTGGGNSQSNGVRECRAVRVHQAKRLPSSYGVIWWGARICSQDESPIPQPLLPSLSLRNPWLLPGVLDSMTDYLRAEFGGSMDGVGGAEIGLRRSACHDQDAGFVCSFAPWLCRRLELPREFSDLWRLGVRLY